MKDSPLSDLLRYARVLAALLAYGVIGGGMQAQEKEYGGQALETVQSALAKYHVRNDRSALVNALSDDRPEVRGLAAQELADSKADETIPLIETMVANERVPQTRINGASALAQLGSKAGVDALISMCKSLDIQEYLRVDAARHVTDLNNPSCLLPIQRLSLGAQDSYVRVQALSLLTELRRLPGANYEVITDVQARCLGDADPNVRVQASAALAESATTSALSSLGERLSIESNPAVRKELEEDIATLKKKLSSK